MLKNNRLIINENGKVYSRIYNIIQEEPLIIKYKHDNKISVTIEILSDCVILKKEGTYNFKVMHKNNFEDNVAIKVNLNNNIFDHFNKIKTNLLIIEENMVEIKFEVDNEQHHIKYEFKGVRCI